MNPELKIYDKLLQFPLFQGMSYAELMQVVAHTKMGFVKMTAGQRIVREGDVCNPLYFLINGTMKAETGSDGHSYSVEEDISAPYMIQPERLFGMYQRYSSSFKTVTPCHFRSIASGSSSFVKKDVTGAWTSSIPCRTECRRSCR